MATLPPANRGRDLGLKTCPYNSEHRVKSSRFQRHIAECAKQYPNHGLKTCPFNASHRIHSTLFSQHVMSCPDSRRVVREAYESSAVISKTPVTVDRRERPDTEDLWKDEYIQDTPLAAAESGVPKTFLDFMDRDVLTADELFNLRFEGNAGRVFSDAIYVQRMTHEERRKYQGMCVERIKILAKIDELKPEEERKSPEEEYPRNSVDSLADHNMYFRERVMASPVVFEDPNDRSLRAPQSGPLFGRQNSDSTTPQKKGIGRGTVPRS